MATRTVRLDEESEKLLSEIQAATGLSVSAVLKQGLVSVREARRRDDSAVPFELYRSLDLGPGGYALAPAREAKAAIRRILSRNRAR
ncbi:MAG: hypothetical protein HYY06_05315 [Deltaproteobacteria bacterium]|nr:hypothetical protein [Deltaproteobacteria bacterium]